METIAAIATPMGPGGIGIIRISGSRAHGILDRLFRPKARDKADRSITIGGGLRSHVLRYGHIVDPVSERVIDEVMAVIMKAPRSYTREDVVEIQSHGGPVSLALILDQVLAQGARLAEAGEFTQRAFLNGRIDLSQAEAVADLINAKSSDALYAAAKQLGGELKSVIEQLIQWLTEMAAELEARIEFPDELESALDIDSFSRDIQNNILPTIQRLIGSYRQGHLLFEGFKVAIVGRPNVGKSSLMNRLVGKDKAIVTPIAGTTRDVVEHTFFLNSLSIHLSDTAGMRCSSDAIEMVGVHKARECLAEADMALVVMEATAPFSIEDAAILKEVSPQKAIVVINKMDLLDAPPITADAPIFNGVPQSRVSALTGEGVEQLKAMILAHGSAAVDTPPCETIVFRARHLQCLVEAFDALQRLCNGLTAGASEDFLSMDLQGGIQSLKKISGGGLDEDILDTIFRNFCIGK